MLVEEKTGEYHGTPAAGLPACRVHGAQTGRDQERHRVPTALRRAPLIPFLAVREYFLEEATFLKLEPRGQSIS